jgi:ssDNA-binding Zn-finger/Zn-ribbon topoisomerase 1
MDKNIKGDEFDLKQIIHTCKKCGETMQFHSTDENDDMFFIEYICPKCYGVIWILDTERQYMKELSEYVVEKIL